MNDYKADLDKVTLDLRAANDDLTKYCRQTRRAAKEP